MTAMDHAAAHERIEDLLLEPTRLRALDGSPAPEDVALREHVAGCPACRADLEAWERLQRQLTDALPRSAIEATTAVEPTELPPSLRARVVSAVRSTDRALGPIVMARARSRRAVATWVGLAASIVLLSGATVITADQVARRAAAEAEAQELSGAIATVERILATPNHRAVELTTIAGAPAGSITWSRHDWVVLTSALPEPAGGQRYRCWLEDGGESVAVGYMEFAGTTAYWAETLEDWATWEIGPDTQFVVTLEEAGSQTRAGPAILTADLRPN